MRSYIKDLLKEINKCTTKQLVLVFVGGAVGILWPLGGLILFLISLKTKFKLYGKVAISCAVVALVTFSLKTLLSMMIA